RRLDAVAQRLVVELRLPLNDRSTTFDLVPVVDEALAFEISRHVLLRIHRVGENQTQAPDRSAHGRGAGLRVRFWARCRVPVRAIARTSASLRRLQWTASP